MDGKSIITTCSKSRVTLSFRWFDFDGLFRKNGKKDGYPLENLAKVYAPKKCQNLQAYLDSFDAVLPLLQSEENLTMAAYDLVKQVSLENVRYLEIRFAPLLHTYQGLSVSQIIDAVCLGIEQGMQDYEVEVNLIILAMRHHSNERNLDLVEKVHYV